MEKIHPYQRTKNLEVLQRRAVKSLRLQVKGQTLMETSLPKRKRRDLMMTDQDMMSTRSIEVTEFEAKRLDERASSLKR